MLIFRELPGELFSERTEVMKETACALNNSRLTYIMQNFFLYAKREKILPIHNRTIKQRTIIA